MDVRRFLSDLASRPDYRGEMAHHRRLEARPARFQDPAAPLLPRLRDSLARQGIARLYTHQARAVDAARAGADVLVVTGTASGKTLTYNLPVAEAILTNPRARALYLFPTKALAQDQLGKLRDLQLHPHLKPGVYDGDTPAALRSRYKRELNLVLTNPDMLHVGILPYHGTWASFLRNLKYVVVDEIHSYRGVFGSHVGGVLRRLRRACRWYGADPQFFCCSATVANPDELMRRLVGEDRRIRVIADDGSPAGAKHVVFWNPPLLARDGTRASANAAATDLLVALLRGGVRTIVFTRARKTAEIILRYARFALRESAPDLAGRIMSYRAGYSPEQRRRIERGLFEGSLLGVTATNALELGVDIGGLDACVLTGYPGSITSTWQQAGRCGRGRDESLVILVALDGPLDQYLVRHPEYFFGRSPEHAIVDPGNPHILSQHLLCAAYEGPLVPADQALFGPAAPALLADLAQGGEVRRRGDAFLWAGSEYPAGRVSIRSASGDAYRIMVRDTGELLGTVETARAFETVHEGAVYLHQGESYRVEQLDIPGRRAVVVPANTDYHTEPRTQMDVLLGEPVAERALGPTVARHGPVEVVTQVLGYRRKQLFSEAVLSEVENPLPPQRFRTHGVWFTLPKALTDRLLGEEYNLTGSIHAIEHAAIGILPLFVLCDRMDVGGVSHPAHPQTGAPTICIHDAIPGGVGIAEKAYTLLEDILSATLRAIEECPCREGCPSCIQSPKCGNNNQPLDKAGAMMVLHHLVGEA
ncbi:MAG: DEAD/DEAH box helicase [Armatimonadetes bacterium]|nr:DEAD/DEAH box helicase [Armatimonadota bacterium]